MPLSGLKVVELAGLAPGPLCGKFLHDFGATVTLVHKRAKGFSSLGMKTCILDASVFRVGENLVSALKRGKKLIGINLKCREGVQVLRKLIAESDVLLEPFRKGVMEKLGLGPDTLLAENPKLIYARLSGYGQHGYYASSAGHDINYLSITGLLSYYGWRNKFPTPPTNFSEFAGGSQVCFSGILLALIDRFKTGKGQVIDSNIVEGNLYVGSWLVSSKKDYFPEERGRNWLDGGTPFYDVYETKDGKFMAVGALEPNFYAQFVEKLGLAAEEVPQFNDSPEENRDVFKKKFKEKTQQEWVTVFELSDACVTPVLSLEEAAKHKHNVERESFMEYSDGTLMPARAPKLSRCPELKSEQPIPLEGEHTYEILAELGYKEEEITRLSSEGAIKMCEKSKL